MGLQSQKTEAGPAAEASLGEPLDVALLTRRMRQGDEIAYRTFYDAYYDRLWRYLLVVTGGNEDAAVEALQSALVRVARYIKVVQNDGVFWGWLTVLARSALSDQSRKRRRYLAFLERFGWQALLRDTPAGNTEADKTLLALLDRDLAKLPAGERELVEKKYFDRRSVREIAAELQNSEKAVESRLVRIRHKPKLSLLEGLKNEES